MSTRFYKMPSVPPLCLALLLIWTGDGSTQGGFLVVFTTARITLHRKLLQSVFLFGDLITVRSYSFGARRIIFLCSYSFGAGEN